VQHSLQITEKIPRFRRFQQTSFKSSLDKDVSKSYIMVESKLDSYMCVWNSETSLPWKSKMGQPPLCLRRPATLEWHRPMQGHPDKDKCNPSHLGVFIVFESEVLCLRAGQLNQNKGTRSGPRDAARIVTSGFPSTGLSNACNKTIPTNLDKYRLYWHVLPPYRPALLTAALMTSRSARTSSKN